MKITRIIALLAVLGIAALAVNAYAARWRPSTATWPVQGVAVSAADGLVDWHAARADGVEFAYVLATDGADRRDPAFASHWADLRNANIRRGAVLRFTLCAPAQDQADQFVAVVPRDPDALPAAIDLSLRDDCAARPSEASVIASLTALIATVERHSGKRVLLRIDHGFEQAYRPSARIPRNVWAIRRFFRPAYLAQPFRIWQANDAARVDGFNRRVRWNVVAQ